MPPVHVLIPTHTTRYLEYVLIGLARQTQRPDTIVVSCDVDHDDIGELLAAWSTRLGLEIWWVRRAHHGIERLCQVRNNGLRHLANELGQSTGRLLVLDGDMLCSDSVIAQHEQIGAGYELVYPYRVNLTAEQTESLDVEQVIAGTQQPPITDDDRAELARRHKRYLKQQALRRLRLAPAHKPKLLGGHFSCLLEHCLKINGFDELYQGWGLGDDDFARRAARMGGRVRVAVHDIMAWHLYHPTRQDMKLNKLPTAQRFHQKNYPLVAEHGVRNPVPQHDVAATLLAP